MHVQKWAINKYNKLQHAINFKSISISTFSNFYSRFVGCFVEQELCVVIYINMQKITDLLILNEHKFHSSWHLYASSGNN